MSSRFTGSTRFRNKGRFALVTRRFSGSTRFRGPANGGGAIPAGVLFLTNGQPAFLTNAQYAYHV
jgi:hypothetical protein